MYDGSGYCRNSRLYEWFVIRPSLVPLPSPCLPVSKSPCLFSTSSALRAPSPQGEGRTALTYELIIYNFLIFSLSFHLLVSVSPRLRVRIRLRVLEEPLRRLRLQIINPLTVNFQGNIIFDGLQ